MPEQGVDEDERDVDIRNKVILNVGGIRHETYVSTLQNIPDTRLYSLTANNPTQLPEFDPNSGEFFYDRHPIVFAQILNYYRTGKLHCPNDVCGPLFEEELAFWGLEDASIETCCWMNYKKHGEAQANLSSFDKIVEDAVSEPDYTIQDDVEAWQQTRKCRQIMRKYQSRIWVTLEEPSSSKKAKIIATTSMMLIIVSVVVSCLETVEYFTRPNSPQQKVINTTEIVCVIWFTVELLVRVVVCPSKRKFLNQIMNWLDFAAIVPFYLQLFLATSDMNSIVVIRIVRLIRVFRVLKLSRHSYSLQILGHTLKSSLSELFLLGFFLTIGVVVFSTLIYYAESESSKTKFTSIPAGFWWAVVTMTTIGYGDIVPDSLPGKLVGTCCAICGVLTIALPIPVIVSNFSLYYSHAKARQKSVKKKRPLVIGAANALKVIGPFVGSRPTDFRPGTLSRNNPASPRVNGHTWPAVAVTGSSFESSEPSPGLQRRCLSLISDRISPWSDNAESTRNPQRKVTQQAMTTTENVPLNAGQRESQPGRSNTSDEHQCDGAHINKGAEPVADNSHKDDGNYIQNFMLPTIEVKRSSSDSQRSWSETDNNSDNSQEKNGTTKRQWRRKRTKKSKIAGQATKLNNPTADKSPELANKIPPGRMGRRDSVFVVGFIGKKWQAKAAKKRNGRSRATRETNITNKELLLKHSELSPKYQQRTSPYDAVSTITSSTGISTPAFSSSPSASPNFHYHFPSHNQLLDLNYFRRSSCPSLSTGSVFPITETEKIALKRLKTDENDPHSSGMPQAENTQYNDSRATAKKALEEDGTKPENEVTNKRNDFRFDEKLSKEVLPKREHSFSSTGSDSNPRGHDDAMRRCWSPLVRQKRLFSVHGDKTDSDKEDDEQTNLCLSPVFENDENRETNFNFKRKNRQEHMEACPEATSTTTAADHANNFDQILLEQAKRPKLNERRMTPCLTINCTVINNNTAGSSSIPERREHFEDENETVLKHSPASSILAAILKPNSDHKDSSGSNSSVSSLPEAHSEQDSHQAQATQDFELVGQHEGPDTVATQHNDLDAKQVGTSNSATLNKENVPVPTNEKHYPVVNCMVDTSWNASLNSKNSTMVPANLPVFDPSDSNVQGLSLTNQDPADQDTLQGHRKLCKSNNERPRDIMTKVDSGIASVESRPSLDSMFSFEEVDKPRGRLNTIREQEKHDSLSAEGIPLPFLGDRQCEKTKNVTVEIRDETVV